MIIAVVKSNVFRRYQDNSATVNGAHAHTSGKWHLVAGNRRSMTGLNCIPNNILGSADSFQDSLLSGTERTM